MITAPHLVAQMTELLELRPGLGVLEVGTGSGYQAAVLAEIAGSDNVVTIERIPELAKSTRTALDRTGSEDVAIVVADGSSGLPRSPPFDHIIVTAATSQIPAPLLEQLAEDGRMVIPVGSPRGPHELILVTKRDGATDQFRFGGVRFVPLVGEHEVS